MLPDRTRDRRQVIDAIAFTYRPGTPWTDLPEYFGSRKCAHNRLWKWAADSPREKLLTSLLAQADTDGNLGWIVAVDSPRSPGLISTPPGPVKRGPTRRALPPCPRTLPRRADRLAHLAADSRSRPLSFVLTPGQAWRHPPSPTWLAHGFRPVGRPGTTPEAVLADKAYLSRAIRTHLRRREVRAVIPRPSDQIARRKKRGRSSGRPAAFDARWAHMPFAPRIRGDVVRRRACRCPDCRAPATRTELCGRFRRFTQEGRT